MASDSEEDKRSSKKSRGMGSKIDRANNLNKLRQTLGIEAYEKLNGFPYDPAKSTLTFREVMLLGQKVLEAGMKRQATAAHEAHGKRVLCPMCRHQVRFDKTDRLKPPGMTRYVRVCLPCAAKVKIHKVIAAKDGKQRG